MAKAIHPDSFALLCFLVLMQNGRGVIDKSPDYITEKTWVLKGKEDAFAALDIHNMEKVVDYCKRWNIELPPEVAQEYVLQQEARMSLADKGIVI